MNMPIKISRILHAGYLFECEQTRLAFDPIFEVPFSRNCFAYPEVRFYYEEIKKLKLDAVFISHYHDDHCSLNSLALLDRNTPIFMFCLFPELFDWIRELGFKTVTPLSLDVPVVVGSFEVIPRRALDEDVDSLFHIKADGLNILNVVDSWIGPSTMSILERTAPWDLVLWPFQTMRELEVIAPSRLEQPLAKVDTLPPEWLEQLKLLRPKCVVPSSCQFHFESWSWYNQWFFPITYEQFENEVVSALPQVVIKRIDPGKGFIIDEQGLIIAPSLSWIEPVGEQNVDYQFTASLRPPKVSDIAKNFEALSEDQMARVFHYCNHGLLERFATLEPSEDPYFQKARFWRLSLYDNQGQEHRFHYLLNQGSLKAVDSFDGNLAWLTEVPIARLYGALEEGETLTSMYVRINDMQFSAAIEKELEGVDVLEDPLLRCLFNGVFGGYQLAQLKRIKNMTELKE